MKIRDARKDDFERLNELYEQLDELHRNAYPDRFRRPDKAGRTEEYFISLLENSDAYLIVAEDEGDILGFAEAYIRKAPDFPVLQPRTWLLIDGIAVDKVYRNKGAGQALFNELINRSKEKGISDIELKVYGFNETAIKFYEKNGFTNISRTMYKKI